MYVNVRLFTSTCRYIGNKVKEADARLLGIKPPNCITRMPQSFRGKAWKGNLLVYIISRRAGILLSYMNEDILLYL